MSHTRRTNCADGTMCQAGYKGLVPDGSTLEGDIEISDIVEILGPLSAKGGCILYPGVILDSFVALERDVIIKYDSIFGEGVKVGEGSTIGMACTIDAGVVIGDDVHIGDGIHIKRGVYVEDGSVIGTIEGGTVIGEFATIMTMSVVQGNLNYIDDDGELVEIDMINAKEILPISSYEYVLDGKRWSADRSSRTA